MVINLETNELVYAAPGHDTETLSKFFEQLSEQQRASITCVAGDGAKWIDACIKKYCPNVIRCLDGFHVIEWAQEALDYVRIEVWREEYKKFRGIEDRAEIEKIVIGSITDKTREILKEASKTAKDIKTSK